MQKAPTYPVPALEKGLDILEALAAVSVPQSMTELAARFDRSSSELFRMLNCLEHRGYVNRDPLSGKYSLTLKLYTLAHAHSPTEKLLNAARLPMQQLTERIRESCHLSVLNQGSLVVVAQEESPERVRLSIEIGSRFDASNTASGRLLLACLPDQERDQVLAKCPSGSTLRGKARSAYLDSLRQVARERLSTASSESIEGVRDLAVLVGEPSTGIIAALAVTRLVPRGDHRSEAELVADMRETAATITRTLGLFPTP